MLVTLDLERKILLVETQPLSICLTVVCWKRQHCMWRWDFLYHAKHMDSTWICSVQETRHFVNDSPASWGLHRKQIVLWVCCSVPEIVMWQCITGIYVYTVYMYLYLKYIYVSNIWKNIYTYILTATLILHGDYTRLPTPTPHSLKKRDGGTDFVHQHWGLDQSTWSYHVPRGTYCRGDDVGGIQGDRGFFTGNKPPSVESWCWIKVWVPGWKWVGWCRLYVDIPSGEV